MNENEEEDKHAARSFLDKSVCFFPVQRVRRNVILTNSQCLASQSIPRLVIQLDTVVWVSFESRRKKICLRGFLPGLTQTMLHSHRSLLEASNFGFKK